MEYRTEIKGDFTHGTRYGYVSKKCGCADCRAWNNEKKRAQRLRRKNDS